jgi:hypothetical protein
MSGLEPLLVAAAPNVLTAVAKAVLSKVAAKVARSVTFRLRVYLRVRRTTALHPAARLYLKWLRDAAKTDLVEPLERAGARLAQHSMKRFPPTGSGGYALTDAPLLCVL